MSEIFKSPEFLTALIGCIVGALGAATAFFQAIKAKQSVNKAKAYAQEAQLKLEAEKVQLQKIIVEGSYVICPKCGASVPLYNAEIKVKGEL